MKNKISNKLYGALLRCGTPPEIAAVFARNAEFLGESTPETMERDNYEIMVVAKAMSSLIKRHENTETQSSSSENDNSATQIINEHNGSQASDTVVISHAVDSDNNEKSSPNNRKRNAFWTKLETLPDWLRNTLAVALPILMYISMIILTVLVVGLIGACILGMVAMTIAGIILFIAGLLFGVSQISVFPAAAYYEIGLGLILGGSSALLIVLLYNALTRLLPFVLKLGIKKLNVLTKAFGKFRAEMKEKAATPNK